MRDAPDETSPRRFRMRPLAHDDLTRVAGWYEEIADLAAFHSRMPLPLGPEAVEAQLGEAFRAAAPRTSYWFGVDDPAGELVAFCGIEDINYVHGDAVTPLFVAPAARGSGLGVRARALLLDLAFDQLGLARITSLHRADNVASHRINSACGLREEGRVRKGWFASGRRVDLLLFGILADEWRDHRESLLAELGDECVVSFGVDRDGRWTWPRPSAG